MPLDPGYYVLSATMLQGIHNKVQRPWVDEQSRAFVQAKKALEQLDLSTNDPQAVFLQVMYSNPRRWLDRLTAYEFLRAESLRLYLLDPQPVERINDSIFVYHLSDEDLRAAVLDPDFGFPEDFPYAVFKAQLEFALKDQESTQ